MRLALSIFSLLLCVSCSTTEQHAKVQSGESAAASYVVSLPRLAVPGVNFEDGLQQSEVTTLASEYFHRFVSGCGMADDPQDDGRYWRVRLWGGYAGTDYGTLRIAKDGSEVLLEPPKGGFKTSPRELLKHQNLI